MRGYLVALLPIKRPFLIAAGLESAYVLTQVHSDFDAARTAAALVATFVLTVALLFLVSTLLSLATRSQKKSQAKVSEGILLTQQKDFDFHPDQLRWQMALGLFEDALQIEPTNRDAADRLSSLIHHTLLNLRSPLGRADEVELPEKYAWLAKYEIPGFHWGRYDARNPPVPVGLASNRLRGFIIQLAESQARIAIAVVSILAVAVMFGGWNEADESFTLRTYSSICESLVGDCGSEISGFSRTDALRVTEATLRIRYPRATRIGEQDFGLTCWDHFIDDETRLEVDISRGSHFIIEFGRDRVVEFDPDFGATVEFFPISIWKVTPPSSDSAWIVELLGDVTGRLPEGTDCSG